MTLVTHASCTYGAHEDTLGDVTSADAAIQAHRKHFQELRPGLHLHCDDSYEAHYLNAQSEVSPGLRIVFLLEGSLDLSYGDTHVRMRCAAREPSACLVSVAEHEHFTRRIRPGAYARRVNIGIAQHWLEQLCDSSGDTGQTLESFRKSHLTTLHWQLSTRGIALAEQLVQPPAMAPLLQNLYLESRSLELVSEAINMLQTHRGGVSHVPDSSHGLHPRAYQRIREFHAFLSSGQADAMSMDDFAKQVGINANSLQKQFRAVYGTTIFDYLRELRLLRARHALEGDGVSVGQAAMIAGYNSAANFSTAYRRRFGISPKLVRARV